MIGFICGLILSQIMASCSEIKIASANPVDHPFLERLQKFISKNKKQIIGDKKATTTNITIRISSVTCTHN